MIRVVFQKVHCYNDIEGNLEGNKKKDMKKTFKAHTALQTWGSRINNNERQYLMNTDSVPDTGPELCQPYQNPLWYVRFLIPYATEGEEEAKVL